MVLINFYCLTLLGLKNLKISIFEIPKFIYTLNINNKKTTDAKSINLGTIRKLIEYFFEQVLVNI